MAKKSDLTKFEFPPSSMVEPKKKGAASMDFVEFAKSEPAVDGEIMTLEKSILRQLNGPMESAERLAFEVNPTLQTAAESSGWIAKRQGTPDSVLKRIAIQDDLIASIVNGRANQVAAFGLPRRDRYSLGYTIEPNVGIIDNITAEQKKELDDRIHKAVQLLETCGKQEGLPRRDRCSLQQWLYMSVKNAITVGRMATELVWGLGPNGEKEFNRFRVLDAGTIYQSSNQRTAQDNVRLQAIRELERLKNEKLQAVGEVDEDIAWVQVIDGSKKQVFTDDQCVVHNFYPVSDIEQAGYPVTPIDTMINAVTTHINIGTHNKMYFLSGRATRGMLVIQSDEIDENAMGRIKQQFMSSINGVDRAWRMPVFSVGKDDKITWSPIDNSARDAEFQYLTDMNARVIFTAFQMAPEELSGWSYLSRGSNNQTMAESNSEFKIEAARDLGIRPILNHFETFLNTVIFPLIDPVLAKHCKIRLEGLDAETAEKESVRLQQDMPVHMSMNNVLQKVEKKPIDMSMGGDYPLNPQFQAVLDKFFTIGQQKAYFMGDKDAMNDPQWAYCPHPAWLSWQQLLDQRQQAQQQVQMQQQQAIAQAQGGAPGASDPQQEGGEDNGTPKEGEQPAAPPQQAQDDLTTAVDQAIGALTKGEAQLPPSKRRMLAHQKLTIKQGLEGIEEDIAAATKEILEITALHTPKKPKK